MAARPRDDLAGVRFGRIAVERRPVRRRVTAKPEADSTGRTAVDGPAASRHFRALCIHSSANQHGTLNPFH